MGLLKSLDILLQLISKSKSIIGKNTYVGSFSMSRLIKKRVDPNMLFMQIEVSYQKSKNPPAGGAGSSNGVLGGGGGGSITLICLQGLLLWCYHSLKKSHLFFNVLVQYHPFLKSHFS